MIREVNLDVRNEGEREKGRHTEGERKRKLCQQTRVQERNGEGGRRRKK